MINAAWHPLMCPPAMGVERSILTSGSHASAPVGEMAFACCKGSEGLSRFNLIEVTMQGFEMCSPVLF